MSDEEFEDGLDFVDKDELLTVFEFANSKIFKEEEKAVLFSVLFYLSSFDISLFRLLL